jgi:hypothetical protein
VLQPKRRDFLLSLSHYCRGASGIANRNGASEEARRYSEEALTSAIEVALGDPARDRHLELLRSAADVYAAYTQLDGDADRSLEAVRWMRRVAELARRQVPGSVELERLGAVADRIEAAGLELQARSLAESTGSSASR